MLGDRARAAVDPSRVPDDRDLRTSGSLFLVGGRDGRNGDRSLLDRFVGLCKSSTAHVLVVTTASAKPSRQRLEYDDAFRSLGADVSVFHPERREDSDAPKLLETLDRADGVYFTGGGQLKLVTTIGGTRFGSRLRERHRAGMPVGGTSAGASAVSEVMIVRGRGQEAARFSSVELSAGLGLLPGVIVDQHFRERDRIGRLLSAVMRNPALLGFGLDEATAAEIRPGGRVSVHGPGTLTVVDGAQLSGSSLVGSAEEDPPLSFAGMRLHVLGAGWHYDLGHRTVELPPPPE